MRTTDMPAGDDSSRPRTVWRFFGVDFDARITGTTMAALFILLVAFNNHFAQGEYERFLIEFLLPMGVVVFLWHENPRQYGLTLGDWRLGLPVTVAGIAILAPVIWFLGQLPDFRGYYEPLILGRPAWQLIVETGLDMFAWEFFFRGWLLGTYGRKYGSDAIWLQTIPFVLMHLWKPEIEQLSTVLGGAFFGILAWRTRSFIWGFLLHWFMAVWVLLVARGYI